MTLGKLFGQNTGPAQTLAGVARQGQGGSLWGNLAQSMVRSGIVGNRRDPATPAPFGPMAPDNLWNSFAGTMMRQNMDRRGVGPDGNPIGNPMPNGIGGVIAGSIQNPTQQPAQPVAAPMGGMMAPQGQMTLRALGQAYAGRGQSGYGGRRI